MVTLSSLFGQGRETVGPFLQFFIVHSFAGRKRTHALFEKSRTRSSRCSGMALLLADTLNRDNLSYKDDMI